MKNEQEMNEYQMHFDNIYLGAQVEEFLRSDPGKKLMELAIDDSDSAKAALVNVDPSDIKKIITLQEKAKTAEYVVGFLKRALKAMDESQKFIDNKDE